MFASAVSLPLCRVCRLCGGRHVVGPARARSGESSGGKPKIRLVFCETTNDKPIWPNIGYDFDARRKQVIEVLTQGCPDVQFLPTQVMDDPKHADDVLQGCGEVDGYVVCVQGLGWRNDIAKLCSTGKPTLLVDNLFGGSGLFLTRLPQIMGAGKPVDWVSSANDQDIVAAARNFALLKQGKTAAEVAAAFRTARRQDTPAVTDWTCKDDPIPAPNFDEALRKLRQTKILVVGGGWGGDAFRNATEQLLGLKLVPITFEELSAAYGQADQDAACAFADRWADGAEKVVEPDRAELERSGLVYVAMKADDEKAWSQRHQHQLPGRVLRRPHQSLPVPGLQPVQQRRAGRRLRGGSDVRADHGHDGRAGGTAGLHLRSRDRYVQEPHHLRALRGDDQGVRPPGTVESVPDPQPLRGSQRGGRPVAAAGRLHDDHAGNQPGFQAGPDAPGQVGRQQRQRHGLPHEARMGSSRATSRN